MSELATDSEVQVERCEPIAVATPATIELVDVRIDHPRDATPLLVGASLRVVPGEVVVIVGAAGVGSSRLVAAALGETPLACGRIEVLGRDVGKLRRASLRLLRRRIGIVPQDLCLLEDRSAQLNVVLPLEIDGVPRSTTIVRAAIALARLGIAAEGSTALGDMSASARQRVAVARALVREPELVLADQPTSLQDGEGAELVCESLAEAAAAGAACVVLSRDPALRDIAVRRRWRQLALIGARLEPLGEHALDDITLDQLLGALDSAPERMPAASAPVAADVEARIPNLVPFPVVDRRSGPAVSASPSAHDQQVTNENENVA